MVSTTLEQSKKLLEIGIDPNTADMCWAYRNDIDRYFLYVKNSDTPEERLCQIVPYEKDVPAWSLSALLELMPERIKIGDELSFCLASKKSSTGFSFSYNFNASTFVADNPLDAAFEMIVWLKENGKI